MDVNTGKTPEAGKEGETRGNTLPVEKDADPTMEQLAERVEQANIDKVPKVTHEALADVMLGWKGEGKVGDNCPKVVMTIPCAVIDHRPVPGKGYFCTVGERVAQTKSEILKSDPEVALSGPWGAAIWAVKLPFLKSLGCYNEDYPQILKCQVRGTNHDVWQRTLAARSTLTRPSDLTCS